MRAPCTRRLAVFFAVLCAASWSTPSAARTATVRPIAPEALERALADAAAQLDLYFIYESSLVDGAPSGGCGADQSVMPALRSLLAASGLQFEFLNPRTVRVYRPAHREQPLPARPAAAPRGPGAPTLDEVLVTATRRTEAQRLVPVSIGLLDSTDIATANLRGIEDIAGAMPGLRYAHDTQFGPGILSTFDIRGISTDKSSPTTGELYDDIPLQMPLNPFRTPDPQLLDLERVEVLRGPQGTLFGPSAMGGVVRQVPVAADVSTRLLQARTRLESTAGGANGGSLELEAQAPIVPEVLGVRIAMLHRDVPGYVDRVDPFDGHLVDANANSAAISAARLSAAYAPAPGLRIEPSLYFENARLDDSPNFYVDNAAPAADPAFASGARYANAKLLAQPTATRLWIGSLKIEKELGIGTLRSYSGVFTRAASVGVDQTNGACLTFFGGCGNPLGPAYPASPDQAVATDIVHFQRVLTQDLRLSSPWQGERLSWIAGLYYYQLDMRGRDETHLVVAPDDPGLLSLTENVSNDLAAYAHLRLALPAHWALDGGARLGWNRHWGADAEGGFANTDPHPYQRSGSPWRRGGVDPRLDLAYQPDAWRYFYLSAARGSRSGGVNAVRHCGAWPAPTAFTSDTVWNYEAGSKLRLAGGRLQLDTSAFRIRWSGMQDYVDDPCGNTYILNAGDAISTGADLDGTLVLSHWRLALGVERLRTYYTNSVIDGLGRLVSRRGAVIGNGRDAAPPWSMRLSVRYDWRTRIGGFDARVEARLKTRNPGPYTEADPAAVDHDLAALGTTPAVRWFQAQLGWTKGPWRVALSADNLANAGPILQLNSDGPGSVPLYAYTLRPRTLAVEVSHTVH